MKVEEQTKLNNFQAQYGTILREISVVNTELENLLKEKQKSLSGLSVLLNEIKSADMTLKTEKSKSETIRADIISKLDKFEKENFKFEKKRQEVDTYTETKTKGLAAKVLRLNSSLDSRKAEKDTILGNISDLNSQVDRLSKISKELLREVKIAHKEYNGLNKQIEVESTANDRAIKQHLNELSAIKKDISISKSKVLDTNSHFSKREADLIRRESDLEIVTRRIRLLFQELKPGTALKI